MRAYTPKLELETLFVLNDQGQIVSTREPHPSSGPLFCLIRGITQCAWATHENIPKRLALEVARLARQEVPTSDFQRELTHVAQYVTLLGGQPDSGPVFTFPSQITPPISVDAVTDIHQLNRLSGWRSEDIQGCAPILGVLKDGQAVSVCFCARRSEVAAEAGVETATAFRGRGLAAQVTAAWAFTLRDADVLPIYSTSWRNTSSLAVARKLALDLCASHWSLSQ